MSTPRSFKGTITDIDLRLYRVFKTIVECGGITSAAMELNIDRSTVSKHLSDLETRIGFRLCDRGRQGFTLTPAGELAYRATSRLFTHINSFSGDIAELGGYLSGVVNIAFADGVLQNPDARLNQAFEQFNRHAPDVHPRLTISSANEIERGIIEGRYDAGIVPFHHAIDGLAHEYIFTEDARLYCGDRHPLFARADADISFTDLRNAAYVDWGYFVNRQDVDGRIQFSAGATVFNNEGAAILILSGRYIGFLPVHYAEQWVETGKIRSLLPEIAYYRKPMAFIYKESVAKNPIIAKFAECLRESHRRRRD